MAITLTPSSSFVTPKYRRTLPVTSVPNPADTTTFYDVIVPSSSRTQNTYAYLVGNPKSQAPANISSQDYFSNNVSPSGITFLSFWNAATIDNVDLEVGPNSSGGLDYGDTILIDSDKAKKVVITNSRFITGNTNDSAINNDKDLVVFGSNNFKDGQSWNGITGLGIDTGDEVDLIGSTVRTGNDRDTVIFASTNTNSVVQTSTINVGDGADYIYFNRTQSVRNGNTILLGNEGAGDGDRDTIVFASNNFSGLTAAAPLKIENFENNVDTLRVGTTNYQTQLSITNAFGGRITFS